MAYSTLTDSAHKKLDDQLMADMDADSNWDAMLSNSQELLEQMAEDALRTQRAGNVHEEGWTSCEITSGGTYFLCRIRR